jgi:HEAT repeat protein
MPLRPQSREVREFHRAVSSTAASWQDREAAFFRLLRSVPQVGDGSHSWAVLPGILAAQPDSGETLRIDLIRSLAKDAAWGRSAKSLPEEFGDYEGDLIAAVAELKDPRSIDALFEVIETGNMALNALAGFGDESLRRAIGLLDSRPANDNIRSSAGFLLAKIAEPSNVAMLKDPSSKNLLLNALLRGLHDRDILDRLQAIKGLVQLGDKSAIQPLSQVAAQESTEAPVRQLAREAVSKLSGR